LPIYAQIRNTPLAIFQLLQGIRAEMMQPESKYVICNKQKFKLNL